MPLRTLRSLCLALVLLLAIATGALAAPSTVTLPSGETFTIEQSGSTTRITLPSGATVTRNDHGSTTSWGAGPSVSDEEFQNAQIAYELWAPENRPRERAIPIWFSLIFIAFGLFGLLAPHAAWYLSDGWKFKDAEPTELAINMARIGGALGIIAGVVLIFIG